MILIGQTGLLLAILTLIISGGQNGLPGEREPRLLVHMRQCVLWSRRGYPFLKCFLWEGESAFAFRQRLRLRSFPACIPVYGPKMEGCTSPMRSVWVTWE